MQDTMAEKRVKDFITMSKIKLLFLCFIFGLFSCNEEMPQNEIPYASFSDIYIQLDLPQYNDLSFDGGYVYLNEGLRGIILYRKGASTYYAFERTCSYRPFEAGATVDVHSSNLYMFDPSCKSSFSFDAGIPTGGPAQLSLRRYQTILNGRTLTITDEPVN